MFATINGLTLHYHLRNHATGQAKPTLVFINSLGSDFRIWDEVISQLPNHQILCYDKRGHGLSDAPEGPYSIAQHGDDLKGLLDHLQLDNVVLIGISVGGMIAQDVALRYPEYPSGLVLCDTGAKIGTSDAWQTRIEAIARDGLSEVAKLVISRWFTAQFQAEQPAVFQGYYNMLARTPMAGYLGTCAALRDADFRAELHRLLCPTLILCGEEDIATSPELSAELQRGIQGSNVKLLPKAAHLPCIEQAELMATHIRTFLEAHHG